MLYLCYLYIIPNIAISTSLDTIFGIHSSLDPLQNRHNGNGSRRRLVLRNLQCNKKQLGTSDRIDCISAIVNQTRKRDSSPDFFT